MVCSQMCLDITNLTERLATLFTTESVGLQKIVANCFLDNCHNAQLESAWLQNGVKFVANCFLDNCHDAQPERL